MSPKTENVLFISNRGETLPVVHALRDEGVTTNIYIHDPVARRAYSGIMSRLDLNDLEGAIGACTHVNIDIILRNSKSDEDLAFLRKFKLPDDSPGLFGRFGDMLKKPPYSREVTGGGARPELVELDRDEGFKLARQVGFDIPPYKEFNSLNAGAKFLYSDEGKKGLWVFKPSGNQDLDLTLVETYKGELLDLLMTTIPQRFDGNDQVNFIIQKKIDGKTVELSSEIWRNAAGKFLHPNRTFENKKLSSGDTGPTVGSQSNTVFLNKTPGVIHRLIQGIPWLKEYIGPIDANCIVDYLGQIWFLEWTFRFGYSALYLLLTLVPKGQLWKWILQGFDVVLQDLWVASQTLTLHPFPHVRDSRRSRQMVKDNLINNPFDAKGAWWLDVYKDHNGKLRCAGGDGLLGVIVGTGDDAESAIKAAHANLQAILKAGVTGDVQYRTEQDHLEKHLERLHRLEKWKVDY
jgi:hypothetical protein